LSVSENSKVFGKGVGGKGGSGIDVDKDTRAKRGVELGRMDVRVEAEFDRIDTNGDGLIDRAEFEAAFGAQPQAKVGKHVSRRNPEEILEERKRLLLGRRLTAEQQTELLEVFELFADEQGWLLTQELRDAMRALGLRPTQAQVDSLITSFATSKGPSEIGFALFVDLVTDFMAPPEPGTPSTQTIVSSHRVEDPEVFVLLSPRGKRPDQAKLWKRVGEVLTKEQVIELIEIFDMFDLDHTGSVPVDALEDLAVALRLRPAQDGIREALASLQSDTGEMVTFEQFVEKVLPFLANRQMSVVSLDLQQDVLSAAQQAELIATFELFDLDGSGFIDYSELTEVLQAYGITSNDVIYLVMRELDKDGDARVSLEEFLTACAPYVNSALGDIGTIEVGLPSTLTDPLYNDFEASYRSSQNIELADPAESSLRELFDLFDTDGSGYVGAEEMAEVMKALGVPSDVEDVLRVMRAVDKGGDGRMSFTDFKRAMALSRQGLLLGVTETNGTSVGSGGATAKPQISDEQMYEMSEAFDAFDIDGNGQITVPEMQQAIEHLGITTTSGQVRIIVDELDLDGDQRVSFDEFVTAVAPYMPSSM